jgi:hypothetical protein
MSNGKEWPGKQDAGEARGGDVREYFGKVVFWEMSPSREEGAGGGKYVGILGEGLG